MGNLSQNSWVSWARYEAGAPTTATDSVCLRESSDVYSCGTCHTDRLPRYNGSDTGRVGVEVKFQLGHPLS
jgi:hypothetical protein